ncbi:MFS transporter, partial [Bordetella pertussis]
AALDASLAQASWLLSAFAAIGAALGAGVGMAVDAWGARRMAVAGMLAQGVASLLGAMAGAIGWLLALRVAEGIGFLAVVVSAPSLIVAATGTAPARARALAAWSTFMPLGVAAAMLSAPALEYLGWSGMWRLYGLALLAYACWLAWGTRGLPGMAAARRTTLARLRATLAAPGPRLYAMLFGLYTAAYFSIFGFLPSILAERLHVAPWAAGPLAALVVAACVGGNLGGGALLARG